MPRRPPCAVRGSSARTSIQRAWSGQLMFVTVSSDIWKSASCLHARNTLVYFRTYFSPSFCKASQNSKRVSPKTLGYEVETQAFCKKHKRFVQQHSWHKRESRHESSPIRFRIAHPIPLVAALSPVTLECPRCFAVLPLWSYGRSMEAVVLLMHLQVDLRASDLALRALKMPTKPHTRQIAN